MTWSLSTVKCSLVISTGSFKGFSMVISLLTVSLMTEVSSICFWMSGGCTLRF